MPSRKDFLSNPYLESRIRSLDKAIKTYGQRISEHQEKLKAYKNNPEATDNKGFLKTAASEDARRKIIQGRIKHINQEIRTFKENIKKAQLEKRNLEKKMRELGKNPFQNETNSPSKKLIGSRRTVTSTIHHLQVIGYADVGDWSDPIPTGNPGEVMSILSRQILIK
ncbi:hypothetical protein SR1949_51670 [Sphaerospermopsis reniformis]|uniref:Uncharacterized protein n=1 Tax=Sphaerospermopsis reniformis TaxID=531300 RepID=A0A480A8I1_9CYAN|nr:hypothetical protein [Sphaerospermopsis reniformis]GCL40033.1 hypothetical protein SR1949_51670 [Sphaerospermopsis reniformis]